MGRRCCFLLAKCLCVGVGNAGFSVYLAHYVQTDTYHASRIDYSAVGGLCFGSGLIFSPVVVYLVGLTNVHVVVFAGAFLEFAAMLLASFTTKLWQLYLTQGLLLGFGLALMVVYPPSITPQWFSRKRSTAMGICAGGSGVGGIIFNLGMQKIMEVKSVQWALRAQAIIVLGIVSICAVLLKKPQNEHQIRPEFHPWDLLVSSSVPFWFHISWIVFTLFAYTIVQYVLADATRTLGYSPNKGSITSALMATGVTVGRPALGLISDRVGPITVGIAVYTACGILCLAMWIPARNLATIYVFSFIEGGLMGYVWGAMGAIIPRITGLKKSSVTFGMTFMFVGAASIVAPIMGLALKRPKAHALMVDKLQYCYVAVFCGLSFLMAAFSLVMLRGYIIARDKIASDKENESGNSRPKDDVQELHLKVPLSMTVRNLFVCRHEKKV